MKFVKRRENGFGGGIQKSHTKKKAGGKDFTYDDVKRKVQIRRGSYERNKKLIEKLIAELNGIF